MQKQHERPLWQLKFQAPQKAGNAKIIFSTDVCLIQNRKFTKWTAIYHVFI